MTHVLDDLHRLRETIRAEERVVGLRPDGHVSEGAVRRRRRQLVLVAVVVLLGLAASALAGDAWVDHVNVLDARIVRVGMILLTVGFAVFLLEKEAHLKRLDRIARLVHEHDLAVADRVLRTAAVADAARGVAATLELDQVLTRTLDRAAELLDAVAVWVLLPGADERLHDAGSRSRGRGLALAPEDVALATRVWAGGRAEASGVGRGTAAAAPVTRGRERLGVLVARAGDEGFGPEDVEVLARLGAVVGPAVHNARVHEALVAALERSRAADRFVAHDLETRVARLRARYEALRAAPAERRDAVLDDLGDELVALEALPG